MEMHHAIFNSSKEELLINSAYCVGFADAGLKLPAQHDRPGQLWRAGNVASLYSGNNVLVYINMTDINSCGKLDTVGSLTLLWKQRVCLYKHDRPEKLW